MSDEDCNCGDLTVEKATEPTENSAGWIDERPVRTARLPEGMADNVSRFFGEPTEGFDDMISAIRNVTDGAGISIDELCHVEDETAHYAETAEDTYYFRCFYDGIALAHLVDEAVEIHTQTPTEDSITMRASPEGTIEVSPSGAVMSFGVATNRDLPSGDVPTASDVYEAVCPYVKAFHTPEEYERWSQDVAATTVGIPLESGVPIASALTAESPAETEV